MVMHFHISWSNEEISGLACGRQAAGWVRWMDLL
jgi:hypothetical protein